MPNVFISYSRATKETALRIRRDLQLNGITGVFLDLDPVDGLRPGSIWAKELKVRAYGSKVVLLLVSQAWLDSEWCRNEYLWAEEAHAASLERPRVPILLPIFLPETPLEVIKERQPALLALNAHTLAASLEVDPDADRDRPENDPLLEARRKARQQLWEWLEPALAKANVEPLRVDFKAGQKPYPGLESFKEEDAAVFFGREAEVDSCVEKLLHMRLGRARNLFTILGASGAGKSSVLRAGLISRLKLGHEDGFYVLPTLRPKQAALSDNKEGLIACLRGAFSPEKNYPAERYNPPRLNRVQQFPRLVARGGLSHGDAERAVKSGPEAVEALLLELQRLASPLTSQGDVLDPVTLVLPIDQAEELLTYDDGKGTGRSGPAEEARKLRELLAAVLDRRQVNLIVVLAIRSDSFPRLQADRRLGPIEKETFDLSPLPSAAFASIIEGPAAKAQITVDADLTAALLRDLDLEGDALPLLAFILRRLDNLRDNKRAELKARLTLEDYTDLGRVKGALEKVIGEALGKDYDATLLRQAFIPHLARVDEETGAFFRRIATQEELDPAAMPMIDALIDKARILIRKREDAAKANPRETTIEVAHEAVLRQWPLLEGWLKSAKNALGVLGTTETERTLWESPQPDGSAVQPYPQERLDLVYRALDDVGMPKSRVDRLRGFIRPEWQRLVEELTVAKDDGPSKVATHARRTQIGNRLDDLGDSRTGVSVFRHGIVRRELERLARDRRFGFAVDEARQQQLEAVAAHLNADKASLWDGLPDIVWCEVPAGDVEMRLTHDETGKPLEAVTRMRIERPFSIAKFPLTIAQFYAFACGWDEETAQYLRDKRSSDYGNAEWWRGFPSDSREHIVRTDRGKQVRRNYAEPYANEVQERDVQGNYPAQFVNWFQAIAYGRWLTDRYRRLGLIGHGDEVRLPTEWEWQQAATGGDNSRTYPWGNEWRPELCRNREGQDSACAVGLYPAGDSPVGASDMSGLMVEWCLNRFDDIDAVGDYTDAARPTRGGAYFTFSRPGLTNHQTEHSVGVHARLKDHPSGYNDDGRSIRTGVRLVCTGFAS